MSPTLCDVKYRPGFKSTAEDDEDPYMKISHSYLSLKKKKGVRDWAGQPAAKAYIVAFGLRMQ